MADGEDMLDAGAPGPRADRGSARRIGGIASGVLIAAFLIWGVTKEWGHVSSYEWHVDAGLLVGGIVALLGFYAGLGIGYVLVVERLGVDPHRVSRGSVLGIWAKSFLGRYVPGTVLMVAGRVVMGREAGIPGRISLAASVYEQTLALVSAAVASLGFLIAYRSLGGVSTVLFAIAVLAAIAVLHPALFRPVSTWLLVKVKREPLTVFLSERQLVGLFAYYGAVNALFGIGAWLLVRSSAGAGAGDVGYVGLSFLLSWVLGMVAFIVPSGLGVRDAAFALALARNVPGAVAVAVAAGTRLVMTAVELVFVAAVVVLQRRHRGSP